MSAAQNNIADLLEMIEALKERVVKIEEELALVKSANPRWG